MSEKFCLKWNDFNSNASKAFGILRNEDYLHDVTLACDDNYQVSAHKLVLSASSEYFKTLFMNNKKHGSTMLICLEGTESGDLNNILDYVYNGEVKIFQDDLDRFLAVAQRYKIQGLISQDSEDQPPQHDGAITEETRAEDSVLNKRNQLGPIKTENNEKSKQKKFTPPNSNGTQVVQATSNINDAEDQINQYMDKLGPGNFVCKICGKTATMSGHIKNHIETHLEGISYSCTICSKSFRSKNSVNKHKSLYHKRLVKCTVESSFI